MNDSARTKYFLDKNGFFAGSAVILLLLTAVFRVIGCWGLWDDRISAVMLIALPVCCSLLMILCILLFGRKGFFLSVIPVLLGLVFFVFKALSLDGWIQTVLSILLYLIVALLYTATVFGLIHTKWILPPLFGLPLLYHIVMIDVPALNNASEPVSFTAGMQELSVLCVMAAMVCVGLGLKKRPARPPKPDRVKRKPASEPAPAPTPEPAPAPEAEAASDPIVSEEVHSAGLTLDSEPWSSLPEEDGGKESDHD